MNELVSHETFRWFLTIVTGVVAFIWVFYDLFNLSRLRGKDPRDPVVHDKRFGYYIGMLVGIVGVVGVLRFHDVL